MQYIPDDLKEHASAVNEIPDYLRKIHALLGAKWKLAAWQRYRINDNWIAGLAFGTRHFRLICDRGYVEIYEITGGKERPILPPEDQRFKISPAQICELLAKAVT